MAESNNIIGSVASVLGQAIAKDSAGMTRQIKVGDPVFEGEVIEASAGGHVELAFRDGSAFFARDRESVTLDGRVFGGSNAQTSDVVGKVASIEGQVFAKGASGVVRLLKVGDPVYEGDIIQTPAGGRVELAFNNGSAYFLRDKESVTLDRMVFGDRAADASEATLIPGKAGELENISRAIAEGNSLDQLLEETSAGRPAVFGRSDDGHSFVQLLRIAEAVDPLGYQFGTRDGKGMDGIVGGDAEENEEQKAEDQAIGVSPTVNEAPTASGDVLEATEDVPVTYTVKQLVGNDSDVDMDTLAIVSVTSGSGGKVELNGDGSVTFAPDANFTGMADFTYLVTDGNQHSNVATVTVNVVAVNDAAVLSSATVALDETDAALSTGGTLTNSDVDNADTFVAQTDVAGTNGTFSITSGGVWSYTANSAFDSLNVGDSVSDTFTVTAVDGTTTSVQVTINGTNDAATIADATVSLVENIAAGTAVTDVNDSFTTTDFDRDGTAIIYSITAGNDDAIFAIDPSTGAITIAAGKTLDYENATSHSLTVSASDGTLSDTATVTVNVTNLANDPPVATNDSGAVDEDGTLTVVVSGVLGNDTDQNPLDTHTVTAIRTGSEAGSGTGGTVGAALAGTYGSLTLNADGSYSYVANNATALPAGAVVTDTFTYTVTDSGGATDTAELVITITGTNDLPVIAGVDTGAVTEDVGVVVGSLDTVGTLTITDPDAGESSFNTTSVTYTGAGMQLGTLSINAAGEWTYTVPNADVQYLGDGDTKLETFTVAAADGTLHTVAVTINGAQDAPSAADEIIPIPKDATHVLSVADFGIEDPDVSDNLTVTITSLPGQGVLWHYDGTNWVAIAINGTDNVISKADIDNNLLVYVPLNGDTGNESFNFTVSDGTTTTVGNTLTFSINIELTVSNPLPVDEGRAVVFAVELSDPRAVATALSLNLGGEAITADYQTPIQYRVQNPATGVYGNWQDVTGDVTLLAGERRLEVKVKTVTDAVSDEYETLTLTAAITNYAEADMANTSALGGTFISDSPSLLVSGPSYIREGADAVFDLELSTTKATSTTVEFHFEGVAQLGTDFIYSIDGGSTWISGATGSITIPADTTSSPSVEVWVRTLTETPNEDDEILRLVATTFDTGIANAGTDVSAASYIVDDISASMNEDQAGGLLISPAVGYTYSALGSAAHGTVVDNGNGTLSYTPDVNYSGTDSFTVTKTNAVGLTVTSTVTVNVTPVADAPTVTIEISDPPVNGTMLPTNVVVNGDFALALTSGWTTGKTGSGSASIVSGALHLTTGSQNTHIAYAEQSVTGLTSGQSYTFSLAVDTAPTVGNSIVMWNGAAIAPSTYSGGIATFTVAASASNTLRLQSLPTKNTTVIDDNVSVIVNTPADYTYTVDATALLTDSDGSETLGNITITSNNLPAGAVLKLRDGTTVVADGDAGTGYSWTVARDQATGLQLTVDRSPGTTFTLTAAATSTETANSAAATGTATTATITMPSSGTSTPNLLPEIGDSDVILSNQAGFVGSVTQTIDTQFGDGTNTFSWVSVTDSLPAIYVNGELVTYTLTVSPDGQTGTVTGTANGAPVFELVIALNPSGDADVTYTQYSSLLGTEVVVMGESMVPGGGNGEDLTLTFGSGDTAFAAVMTGENYVDGTTTTINTSSKYIGAANNLMNPGEKITLDFSASTTANAVSSMQISFFNFDSESASAPDELTIIGTTVEGIEFRYSVVNASLDTSGMYTITSPDGMAISKLVFEAGTQSSFKLGIESVSAVKYDVNFDLALDYQLTDVDGDSATGTISITLDGDNAIIGTTGDDVLLGGSANDSISGDSGADIINGGAGDDTLAGGAGNDLLGGGLGADVFAWSLADKGVAGSPAVDTITDFNTAAQAAGGDVLDLRDLLSGENSGNLADYLHFEKVGNDTVVHIKSTGAAGAEDQTVLLQDVDLYAAAGIGIGSPDQDIINDLVAKGKLITD